MKEKIEKLDDILKRLNAPVLNYFNSGISRKEIIKFFSENKFSLNEDLISLYEWHNGIHRLYEASDVIVELLPFGKFFNLSDLKAIKKVFLDMDYLGLENPMEYTPFCGSGEEEMYLINPSGIICYLSPAANIYCEPYFESLNAMLDFVIECYNKKIFIVDEQNGLKINDDSAYYEALERFKIKA